MIKRCSYPGCAAATEAPGDVDGWTWFTDLTPGLPDGFYSAAIETIISEGGFEDPDNDLVGENLA